MDNTLSHKSTYDYWRKQDPESPLFPDILWEKPERRDLAGKLLIVGGSSNGIHDIAESYEASREAGVGEARILVPETLRPLTKHIERVDFLPATPTGNISLKAEEQLLFTASQLDGVLLPGNIGRNSETSMLLARFIKSYSGKLTLTKDAIDALYGEASYLLERPDTLLVVSSAQLQRLAREIKSPVAFKSDMDFLVFIERLHDLCNKNNARVITKHHDQIIFGEADRIVSTNRKDLSELWCVDTASKAMTFWLHHPGKVFEAITSSILS